MPVKMLKEPKDRQVQLVYDAEWATEAYDDRTLLLDFMFEGEEWLASLMGTAWFRREFPHMQGAHVRLFEAEDRSKITSWAVINEITCPQDFIHKMILLHELAHLCNKDSHNFKYMLYSNGFTQVRRGGLPSHGRTFCRIYLKLVRRFLGVGVHRQLKIEFDKREVAY